MQRLISVSVCDASSFEPSYDAPFYTLLLLPVGASFAVDGTAYELSQAAMLFLSPCQHLVWQGQGDEAVPMLQFHGDYYCIEYHKKEVACNGFLFNNIYLQPFVYLPDTLQAMIKHLMGCIDEESQTRNRFSDAVVKSYLQLILALCSKAKSEQTEGEEVPVPQAEGEAFRGLLEAYFREERSVTFYAERMCLSPELLSKKVKAQLGKTPMQLIQERVILEAKRLLHLTYKTVKEVAVELNFDDEFYFSRYFKKAVGLSPKHFREQVGVSIVARL